ncbi:unnamed protein product [Orchesella dallaii]|uniref:G-protein coupled receptors family 1 profile domain-containing protein n=1 Tax=Orchesella dallaii TaxID=48710 RepID=A0ABP1QLB0_9HEXA
MSYNQTIDLPLLSCHIVELPEQNNRTDCSISNPNNCVRCPILGRFVAGGGLDEFGTPGHVICLVQWILAMFIGIFGTFTNILIITILKRQNSGRAFDILLIVLACFDFIGSVMSVIATTATVGYFENWNRGPLGLYLFYIGSLTAFFGRSGSSFTTVLITVERFLVITFPMRSSTWFTVRKTKLYAVGIFIFAAFNAIPRFTSFVIHPIERYHIARDIPSLKGLDYVVLSTVLEEFWYRTTGAFFDQIDFWFPLPTLLFFHFLLFIQIRKFSRRRKTMNMKEKKDIRALKMFIPVVFVLFLCNIEPYVHYYYIRIGGYVYREHFVGVLLSIAVNSAVNLPIYYFKGSSFRNEVRGLFSTFICFALCKRRRKDGSKERSTATALTVSHSQGIEARGGVHT